MNADSSKGDTSKARAVATIVNSKAAEKLADAVKGLVQLPHNALDYLVGPKRISSINAARAEGALVEARTHAEIERIRAETAGFVLDREMHKALNRKAILAEAQKALPPPAGTVSDEAVSKDFIHTFFDEFDGISDPEVHKIVGRLLAGEVVRPGSFPRRTMRVLRDLESCDFALFTALCRFGWNIGELSPIVFEPNDPIYKQHGLNFGKMTDLAALGLVSFGGIAGYVREGLPPKFNVSYGSVVVHIELNSSQSNLNVGKVLFTEAGERLAPLTSAIAVPGFVDFVLAKWNADGHKSSVVGSIQVPTPAAAGTGGKAA